MPHINYPAFAIAKERMVQVEKSLLRLCIRFPAGQEENRKRILREGILHHSGACAFHNIESSGGAYHLERLKCDEKFGRFPTLYKGR